MDFAAGMRVSARGLAWDLVEVERLGAQQRLRLRCATGDLRGFTWDILTPHEQVEILRADLRPEAPGSLAAWRLHLVAALLEQVPGAAELLATEPGRLNVEPFQLVPLMRALEMPRPRLLLADGVGLGKTIQAGLIATELIARRRAHRILVVSPAGPLLVQWQQELRQRFGLRFVVIADAAALQQERRRLELGGNPFDSIALCLVSLDFAKQERVVEELERSAWDLAIIDEAHHCIGNPASSDRDDTLRRRLAEVIAQRCDGLLLLTATPHDGFDAHFASLIELLDPSLVDGHGGLVGMAYRRHVVRRLKAHLRNSATGAGLFRDRRVIPVRVELHGRAAVPVQAFHKALAALVTPRLRRATRGSDYADALAFVGLLKRSVSTIAACVGTLRVVAERYARLAANDAEAEALRRERARALRAYRRRTLRFGVLDSASEDDAATLEAEAVADELRRRDAAEPVREALLELIRLGDAAESFDPKLAALLDEIRLIRLAYPATNILIYTEYADSQLAALHALRQANGIAGEVLAISGLDAEQERTRIAERCAEQDGIILVSTDSMAEGLNLHARCFHLIHLDLPYNPNRLEQRNGRIDRYGQQRDPQIRYLYLAGTFEERLLLRLIAKYEKARARLTFMPETLGVTAEAADRDKGLVAGFAEAQESLFTDAEPAIRTLEQVADDGDSQAFRDLMHEIDRAFAGYERDAARHRWLVEQGAGADLALTTAAECALRHGEALAEQIDLPGFVAAAIAEGAPAPAADCCCLSLPGDWAAGMDDLPGYDAMTRTLRVTRVRDRLRDADGRSLAFLGVAHPLVRRAIARVRHGDPGLQGNDDSRVSVARGDHPGGLAVLLLFSVEIASVRRVELQRLVAVLLPESGAPTALAAPRAWLRFAAPERVVPVAGLWQEQFASWVQARAAEAEALATTCMNRLAAEFIASRQDADNRDSLALAGWLQLRADDLCGRLLPRTGDLFDAAPVLPPWRTLASPVDRLAAFAADADNPPVRRREANNVVALAGRRRKAQYDRCRLSSPRLRPAGMLLLLPCGAEA